MTAQSQAENKPHRIRGKTRKIAGYVNTIRVIGKSPVGAL